MSLVTEKDDRLFIKYFYGDKGMYVIPLNNKRRENLLSLIPVGTSHFPQLGFPCFGLDHINRNPKRSRSIFEKAIKIHN